MKEFSELDLGLDLADAVIANIDCFDDDSDSAFSKMTFPHVDDKKCDDKKNEKKAWNDDEIKSGKAVHEPGAPFPIITKKGDVSSLALGLA